MTVMSAWLRAFSEASSFWRLLGGGATVAMLQSRREELVIHCAAHLVVEILNSCAPNFRVENSLETFPGAPSPRVLCLASP
jgi:hypothetical protein